ncbi:CRAL-TRIO-N domain-containing protein [Favolaschia claudopus]|uniref:CRAL-TRIO-N domain-containing protein n=1 Tax=Favolaschia claudopus TaxID=2862362 RepID=A0AAW0C265_9AGAR
MVQLPISLQVMIRGLYDTTVEFFALRNTTPPFGVQDPEADTQRNEWTLSSVPGPSQRDHQDGRSGTDSGSSPMRRTLENITNQLARSQAEVSRLEERCRNLERVLRGTKEMLEARESELETMRKVGEPRSTEEMRSEGPPTVLTRTDSGGSTSVTSEEHRAQIRSNETFMTRTDNWSGAQVIQAVHDLNSEIIQFAASAVDLCTFDLNGPSSAQAMHETTARMGPNLANLLSARERNAQDPTLVGLALQATMATYIARAAAAFALGLPARSEVVLAQVYAHIFLAEPQPTSSRWRAITHKQIHALYPGLTEYAADELRETMCRWVSDVLVAACATHESTSRVWIRDNFGEQAARIVKAVASLARLSKEEIMSTNFELFIIEPGAKFNGRIMTDAFGDYEASQGGVLATTELGLRRMTLPDDLATDENVPGNGPNGADAEIGPENVSNIETILKKKKKKKPKKSAAAKARDATASTATSKPDARAKDEEAGRPPVLCISRNKHWRYISSYHGPWLQLPVELLESLLTLNLDPATLAAPEPRPPPLPAISTGSSASTKRNGIHNHTPTFSDISPPDSPLGSSLSASITFSTSPSNMPPLFPVPEPGKPTPPPIDPGVFRNVTSIRRLIDEAAELSVRASSGLSAAELNMMRSASPSMNSPYSNYNSPWGGLFPGPGGGGAGGRNVAMSAMRIHRLRALAVQKLAAAYSADEIASSVMVMQGGSVFDDLAERVLKVDPNDADAKYVHFFHEKIPSRQLAESTTTQVLDELIQMQPQKLEYYRTRGIVHCFRDEYSFATKDFTYALKEARAVRKAKVAHNHNYTPPTQNGKHSGGGGKSGKKRKGSKSKKFNDDVGEDAPEEGGDGSADDDASGYVPHPSVLPDAPTPLEPQLLFLRGAAYLQHAVHIIESNVLKLEGVQKYSTHSANGTDGNGGHGNGELRLSYLEGGLYGGVELGNPDGPLGRNTGKKAKAYRELFGTAENGEGITGDGEPQKKVCEIMNGFLRTLTHLTLVRRSRPVEAMKHGIWLKKSKSIRPGSQAPPPPHPHMPSANGGPLTKYDEASAAEAAAQPPPPPTTFTTYHPLLVEAHFSILLCQLLLGEFTTLLTNFVRTASIVDGLEGYPVFLPPRSMAQAEFIEALERLASGWRTGIRAYTVEGEAVTGRGKDKAKPLIAIEGPVPTTTAAQGGSSSASGSGSTSDSASTDFGNDTSASSSSSTSPAGTRATTPTAPSPHAQALNSARILLAPVVARQRAREVERKKNAKAGNKKPVPINIPLHGPRVDVVLAWLGAVQIPALEAAA